MDGLWWLPAVSIGLYSFGCGAFGALAGWLLLRRRSLAAFPPWFDELRAYAVSKGGVKQHEADQWKADAWRREYDDGRTPAEAFWHRAYVRASRGRQLSERPAL
jgi:hypothetical protein